MILRLAFTLLVGLSLSFGSLANSFPDKYDDVIRQSAKRYLPGVKWQLLKAQLYQESLDFNRTLQQKVDEQTVDLKKANVALKKYITMKVTSV